MYLIRASPDIHANVIFSGHNTCNHGYYKSQYRSLLSLAYPCQPLIFVLATSEEQLAIMTRRMKELFETLDLFILLINRGNRHGKHLKQAWICLQRLIYTYQSLKRFRLEYPCHSLILIPVSLRISMLKTSPHGFHHGYTCFDRIFKSMQVWISMLKSMLPKLHHGYPCTAWIFKSILAWISMIKIHASMDIHA